MTVEVEIDLRPLLRTTRPEIILEPAQRMIDRLALETERKAREGTPRDTGALRRDIVSEVRGLEARIGFARDVTYYEVMEVGRRKGAPMPPPSALRGWAGRHGKATDPGTLYALARGISKRGIEGRFFMKAAADYAQSRLPQALTELAREIGVRWEAAR